jgi:hypothetical protein
MQSNFTFTDISLFSSIEKNRHQNRSLTKLPSIQTFHKFASWVKPPFNLGVRSLFLAFCGGWIDPGSYGGSLKTP